MRKVLEEIVSVPIHIDRAKTRPNSINPQIVVSSLAASCHFKSPYLGSEEDCNRREKDIPSAQLIAVVYKFVGLLNAQMGVAEYLPSKLLV